MSWSRRRLIGAAGMLAGISAAGVLKGFAAEDADGPRRIVLTSAHSPQSLDVIYRRGGDYLPRAMSSIEALLGDHRTGTRHPIDPRLVDYLFDAARLAGADPVFAVISGYRSPPTLEMPRERGGGVSSHSLHVEGRAIDLRLAGVASADLAEHALAMRRGGVGYYRKADFVHLDTGRARSWRG